MVLLTALALVFAIGRLLTGAGHSAPQDTATVTAGRPTGSTPTAAPASAALVGPLPVQPSSTATSAPVVLAVPSGPCAVDEITVTPTISTAVAGGRIGLTLELTGIKPACTFTVSPRTLVAKVTSGSDRIWSSQDCPAAIRTASVIVRSATPTRVDVNWSGRRSDDECSRSTTWALPGYYHLAAAAIGSEPAEVQFRLTSPPRPVVTRTAKPKKQKSSVGGKGTVYGGDNAAPAH